MSPLSRGSQIGRLLLVSSVVGDDLGVARVGSLRPEDRRTPGRAAQDLVHQGQLHLAVPLAAKVRSEMAGPQALLADLLLERLDDPRPARDPSAARRPCRPTGRRSVRFPLRTNRSIQSSFSWNSGSVSKSHIGALFLFSVRIPSPAWSCRLRGRGRLHGLGARPRGPGWRVGPELAGLAPWRVLRCMPECQLDEPEHKWRDGSPTPPDGAGPSTRRSWYAPRSGLWPAARPSTPTRYVGCSTPASRSCASAARPRARRVSDIVDAAGLSRDAFYRHFASKEDLVAAIVEAGAQRLRELPPPPDGEGTPIPGPSCGAGSRASCRRPTNPEVAHSTRAVLWNGGRVGRPGSA